MNDNDIEEELSFDEAIGSANRIGTLVERGLTVGWLAHTAAQFLFADECDPALREYGTTVLEMIIEAIQDEEHWRAAAAIEETLQ